MSKHRVLTRSCLRGENEYVHMLNAEWGFAAKSLNYILIWTLSSRKFETSADPCPLLPRKFFELLFLLWLSSISHDLQLLHRFQKIQASCRYCSSLKKSRQMAGVSCLPLHSLRRGGVHYLHPSSDIVDPPPSVEHLRDKGIKHRCICDKSCSLHAWYRPLVAS